MDDVCHVTSSSAQKWDDALVDVKGALCVLPATRATIRISGAHYVGSYLPIAYSNPLMCFSYIFYFFYHLVVACAIHLDAAIGP